MPILRIKNFLIGAKAPGNTILRGFALCLLFLTPLTASSQPAKFIQIYLSKDTKTYHHVADRTIDLFKKNCNNNTCRDMAFKKSANLERLSADIHTALVISIGTKAVTQCVECISGNRHIRTMMPKQILSAETHLNESSMPFDIYIDQPYSRYFKLINSIIPRATRAGVLLHEENTEIVSQLEKTADEFGLKIKTAIVENGEIGRSLSNLLHDIDVLLALPDSRIHNSKTIPNILTASYRNKIPVIGFSDAYTKAGAIASVFTSINDIAKETAEASLDMINLEIFPVQRSAAKYFSISINHDVARSLGITTPADENVLESLNLRSLK